jgi:hypothetical protein
MSKNQDIKSEEDKIGRVMREFNEGRLKTKDGKTVKSEEQAIAIAISEAERLKKKKKKEEFEIAEPVPIS